MYILCVHFADSRHGYRWINSSMLALHSLYHIHTHIHTHIYIYNLNVFIYIPHCVHITAVGVTYV